LGVKFPVALSPISRRGRKTKNNGRVVSSIAIAYSIRKSRDEKEKTLKLENDIQILENQMNLNPTEFIQASLNQKKGKLENCSNRILIVLKYGYLFH
jgi:hypothetical protein